MGIEYELLSADSNEPTLSYCFRVAEHTIGHPGVESSFVRAAGDVQQLLRHEGRRQSEALLNKPRELLFRELQAALIVDFDPSIEPDRHWDEHLRFVALPGNARAFEGWSGFLLEGVDVARLLWCENGRRPQILEHPLAVGDFDAALRAFQGALREQGGARSSAPPTSGERFTWRHRSAV